MSFVVDDIGIKPSDSFIFYHFDLNIASYYSEYASEGINILKVDRGVKKEILGDLILFCCAQSDLLFGRDIVKNLSLSDNFLNIPVVRMFFEFVLNTYLINFLSDCFIFC